MVLIDFGFARKFVPGKLMTTKVGTVNYTAPEVLEGRYDEKCDIWSLGVVFYAVLSGCFPFN